MVTIRKRVRANQTYYYLEHSIRMDSAVVKKEKYLGKKVPKNVEAMKRDFLAAIFLEKWRPLLDRIKQRFSEESKRMPPSLKEKEMDTFTVRFTYDTQRIEGSRLSLRETAELLERGTMPSGKDSRDIKEAEAHRDLFHEMLHHEKDISLQTVLYWHKRLFKATKPDIAGRIRQHQVAISGSRFEPPFPAELYPLLREFFKWYAKNMDKMHPVELAALAHPRFVTIHPFADGNGRISRLIMNFILHRHGYPLLNIPYDGRKSYYNALERSQTKNLETVFLQWLVKRYIKAHEKYLRRRGSRGGFAQ